MSAWEDMAEQILANAPHGVAMPEKGDLIRQLQASFPEEADMAVEFERVSTTDQIVRAAFMLDVHPVGIDSFLECCREGRAVH